MAQGEFTKGEANETEKSFDSIFKALTKRKQVEFIGEVNDIFLFLAAAKAAAPVEVGDPPSAK